MCVSDPIVCVSDPIVCVCVWGGGGGGEVLDSLEPLSRKLHYTCAYWL